MSNKYLIIKVYLDTCILSRLGVSTIKGEQLKSLDKICDYDYIDFVTSEKTLEEILKTKDDVIRITLKVLYKIINKFPYRPLSRVEGGRSFPKKYPKSYGMRVYDELFSGLKEIFPHKDDAEHIFQAAKEGCKYFMTLDGKSILKKAKKFSAELKGICPNLEFVDPKTLLERIK